MNRDPETLPALLEMLGFSMSEFFNDDGSLKSSMELARQAGARSLPSTLADHHYHLTTTLTKHRPPAERFAMFVESLALDPNPDPVAPIHRIIWLFFVAIVASINAGKPEEMCVNEPEPKDTR